MDGGSVTSKGQVTIPKKVRTALGITTGTKVAFAAEGGTARLTVVRARKASRVEDGPGILNYSGPRIPVDQMHGGLAMKKSVKRARR
jgi:antitoxin PrlF